MYMETSETTSAVKATPAEKSWLEHLRKTEQETPNRIEDAAKFLATMISVSFSLFVAIGKDAITNTGDTQVKFCVILWLASLALAFFVLYPFRYRVFGESAQSIKAVHRKIVIVKRTLLILSALCFFLALMLLGALFFF